MAGIFSCTGACGIVALGTSSVQRHWNIIATTTPTQELTIIPPGCSAGWKLTASALPCYATRNLLTADRTLSGGYWLHFPTTSPPATTVATMVLVNASGNGVVQITTARVVQVSSGVSSAVSGPTLSADTWYWITWKYDSSGASAVITATVYDSTGAVVGSEFSATQAQAAANVTAIRQGSGTSYTGTFYLGGYYWDDDQTKYPLAPRKVVGLTPNADGTHSVGSGAFQTNGAAAITNGTTTAWQSLPTTTVVGSTPHVRQTVSDTAGYLEFDFNTSETAAPDVVTIVANLLSQGAGAHTQKYALNDAGTITDVVAATDFSQTTDSYCGGVYATAPTSGSWTATILNALKVRWGYGGAFPDNAVLGGLMLEVAFPAAAAATTLSPAPIATPLTVPGGVLDRSLALSPAPIATPLTVPGGVLDRSLALSPGAVATPLTVPASVLSSALALSPPPVALVLSVPAPALGLSLALLPIPVPAVLSVPGGSIQVDQAVAPSPVAVILAVPVPAISLSLGISPSPIAVPLTVSGGVLDRILGISPAPVAASLQVPGGSLDRSLSLGPGPVAASLAVPGGSLGNVLSLGPSPIVALLAVPAPVVSRSLSLGPLPVAAVLASPGGTLDRILALSVSPVPIVLLIPPSVVESVGGSVGTLTPAPIPILLTVPAPVLTMGAASVQPVPIGVLLQVGGSVEKIKTLQPTAIPAFLQVPGSSIGSLFQISPLPIEVLLQVVAPQIEKILGLTPSPSPVLLQVPGGILLVVGGSPPGLGRGSLRALPVPAGGVRGGTRGGLTTHGPVGGRIEALDSPVASVEEEQ